MKPDELDTLLLENIPEHPGTITSNELADVLERIARTRGETLPQPRSLLRTIQRALNRLADTPALICEDSKPNRWSWQAGRKRQTLMRLDSATALAFGLLERHLDRLIPEPHRSELAPLFAKAEEAVNTRLDTRAARWKTRTASATAAFVLPPPNVKPDVLHEVQTALMERRQLALDYRKPGAVTPRRHLLHPQGLVLCGGVFHLIAVVDGYEEPIQFVLHRAEHAEATPQPSRDIPGFDAAHYVGAQRGLQYVTGKTLRLRLRISGYLATILRERLLAPDQVIKPIDDEWHQLTATMPESEQIEWWLASWGDACEVLAPARLRQRMLSRLQATLGLYAATPLTHEGASR